MQAVSLRLTRATLAFCRRRTTADEHRMDFRPADPSSVVGVPSSYSGGVRCLEELKGAKVQSGENPMVIKFGRPIES